MTQPSPPAPLFTDTGNRYSYTIYTGDGQTTVFAVPFPCLDRSDVIITVDKIIIPITEYEWLSASSIRFRTASPPSGSLIQIQRITDKTNPVVDFRDGSTLTEHDLDLAVTQLLYICQEAYDALDGETAVAAKEEAKKILEEIKVLFGEIKTFAQESLDDLARALAAAIAALGAVRDAALSTIKDERVRALDEITAARIEVLQLIAQAHLGAVEEIMTKQMGALTEINNARVVAINTISTKHLEAVQEITGKHTVAVDDIVQKHTEAINAIKEEGGKAVLDVRGEADSAVRKVLVEGDRQVARVAGEGDTWLTQMVEEADRAAREADRAEEIAGNIPGIVENRPVFQGYRVEGVHLIRYTAESASSETTPITTYDAYDVLPVGSGWRIINGHLTLETQA